MSFLKWGRRHRDELFVNNFNVFKLTDENYHDMLNQSKIWLIDYYAPWCPHCQRFAPHWEVIADHYARSKNLSVGAVDCTSERHTCSEEKIFGYPGIKLFNVVGTNDSYSQLNHAKRDPDGIVEWVEEILKQNDRRIDVHGLPSQHYKGIDKVIPENPNKRDVQKLKLERLDDAATAFVYGIEHCVFIGTNELDGQRYQGMLDWLDAVSGSFPGAANRVALQTLHRLVAQKHSWTHDAWNSIVEQWKEEQVADGLFTRKMLWKHCSSYTCGLWTLLHVMTLNIEHDTEIEPANVMEGIRRFIEHFFGCKECVKHFMKANPPSIVSEIASADFPQQKLSLWIWKMHNAVNRVLDRELWPLRVECAVCYYSNESFNDQQVFKYLELSYRIPNAAEQLESDAFAVAYRSRSAYDDSSWWVFFLFSLSLCMLLALRRCTTVCRTKQAHED